MNVLFISQCRGNALARTRRILDQFAERRGERTWQTPITQDGLNTVRRLLRRSARRNTAVACHWVRSRDHTELLWIVGNAAQFNNRGAVPTHTTQTNVLRREDENDWHTGTAITLLTRLAALFHDLGKACQAFQDRLKGDGASGPNRYRHEWISLRLFEAFVGQQSDSQWLQHLADGDYDDHDWLETLTRDGLDADATSPFPQLPPLARSVGWLILAHHRLPIKQRDETDGFRVAELQSLLDNVTAAWNQAPSNVDPDSDATYWRFERGLPVTTPKWRQRASRVAQRAIAELSDSDSDWLANPYVMHLARLSLMLADHHYSSLEDKRARERGDGTLNLHANTGADGQPSQPLDEHLLGVDSMSRRIANRLPDLNHALPRLARHRGFRKRSPDARFRWQDRACDLAMSLREASNERGFFGINMASTGCGKTVANGRIIYALADPDRGARFAIALGLRTLTLQTGQVYRERLGLGADALAMRVGGSASQALFEHFEEAAEATGSASRQQLLEEDGYVAFEGDFENHPLLQHMGHDPSTRALIGSPVLVSTVDHLMPATESRRGGRQIAPMLRLLTSDLVLDEIDDYGLEDLPALNRLVNWAGMLGSRVLLSSATLPPALVEGLFQAYREGRRIYRANRGEPGTSDQIVCAWFDEHARHHIDCADRDSFRAAHNHFSGKRYERLGQAETKRRAALEPIGTVGGSDWPHELAETVQGYAMERHASHHSLDPRSGKRVSFGLIRFANIDSLIEVARALLQLPMPAGSHLHATVYHSRFAPVVRSTLEYHLDRVLDRRDPDTVFGLDEVRTAIDAHEAADHLFVVLGSPVTEVGRDHDYDWAIVEPSSLRSIIQLAGRVQRHREQPCTEANLTLLSRNIRSLNARPGEPAYVNPGFEARNDWLLASHDIHDLLREGDYASVDSRPRIQEADELTPQHNLADLEHARLRALMLPQSSDGGRQRSARERRARPGPTTPPLNAATWYQLERAHLTGELQKHQPFRQQTEKETELMLTPDEAGEDWRIERLWYEPGKRSAAARLSASHETEPIPLNFAADGSVTSWLTPDYLDSLNRIAERHDWTLDEAAQRVGVVTVPSRQAGWRYHIFLGFTAKKGGGCT